MAFEREVKVDGVSLTYGGAKRAALDQVSLTVRKGSWTAVIGPSGAGKSTLVDVLLGLLRPTHGRVVVDGLPIDDEETRARWQQRCAYVPQQVFLLDDTVARNISFEPTNDDVDVERLERSARIAQIHDVVRELPSGYATSIGERGLRLSGGQRQRVGVARALYRQPALLVLDEATNALDGPTETALFSALREAGSEMTVVSIAHRLDAARHFDRILRLQDGRVLEEIPADRLGSDDDAFAQGAAG